MDYMHDAIEEAYKGIRAGDGGPFGAVIVKDGRIVGRGHNSVIRDQDATMHGEIAAIRDASRTLGTFDLSGCTLYSTAEPCPMCLCASMWADIDRCGGALTGQTAYMQSRIQGIGMKRAGTPDEVAAPYAFLASSDSDYITGEAFKIDGGVW